MREVVCSNSEMREEIISRVAEGERVIVCAVHKRSLRYKRPTAAKRGAFEKKVAQMYAEKHRV